jgi:hypothetical protein
MRKYNKMLDTLLKKLQRFSWDYSSYDTSKYPVIKGMKGLHKILLEFERKEKWLVKTFKREHISLISLKEALLPSYGCIEGIMRMLDNFDASGYVYLRKDSDDQNIAPRDERVEELIRYSEIFTNALWVMDGINMHTPLPRIN